MMVVIRPKRKKIMKERPLSQEKSIQPTVKSLIFLGSSFFRRRKKTLAALSPIHTKSCAQAKVKLPRENKLVLDGMWTTLICMASKPEMTTYIKNSTICMQEIIPSIIKGKIKDYEHSKENKVRSLRVLYEGGLISKRKYTSIRNNSDVVRETEKKKKT